MPKGVLVQDSLVAEEATGAGDVPTPDYYSYRWEPIASAETDGEFVRITWPDGVTLDAYRLWLKENGVGTGGVDLATRHGLIDPADLTDDIALAGLDVTGAGALAVTWSPDGEQAVYHPGWLRHVAEGHHTARSWLPEPEPWTAADLPEPPSFDGTPLVEAPDSAEAAELLRRWVDALLRHGIARLRKLGTDHDTALRIGGRIGAVRDTNFGPIWDVKADIDLAGRDESNSTANTTLRLGPHTDLPTRETPPGFQFLHCVANTTEGGHSTMADGAAVVAHLAEHHPDDYEALCTLRWIFFNRGPNIDHRWSGPMIDHGVTGTPLTLRAFYPLRAFPDMDPADVPRAYAAARRFARVAADDRFQMRYPFAPGDLVGFDNRRVLHGRDAYSSGGRRHLRGIYIDQDEVRSFARVANRRAEQALRAPNRAPNRTPNRTGNDRPNRGDQQ